MLFYIFVPLLEGWLVRRHIWIPKVGKEYQTPSLTPQLLHSPENISLIRDAFGLIHLFSLTLKLILFNFSVSLTEVSVTLADRSFDKRRRKREDRTDFEVRSRGSTF